MKTLMIMVFVMFGLAGCALFQAEPTPDIGESYSQANAAMHELPTMQTITDSNGETDIYDYDQIMFGGCNHTVMYVHSGIVTAAQSYFVAADMMDPDTVTDC